MPSCDVTFGKVTLTQSNALLYMRSMKGFNLYIYIATSTLRERLCTHEIFTKDKIVVVIFSYLQPVLHKIICCGYLLESPPRGVRCKSGVTFVRRCFRDVFYLT